MVKVSVIVPAYNMESYIHQCMKSLLNQTLNEIEFLIVDDGSKDNTLEILREYEAKYPEKVRVFHKENGGQSSARNLALQHAKGEYLGFVDSDDWTDPEMFEVMYQKAKADDADIVVCDMQDHYVDRVVYHDYTHVPNKQGFAGNVINKIFRREFAEGVTFPLGLWYEDLEYSAKLLAQTERVSVVHEGLYQYNCRDGSTMRNNNSQKNKDILTILNHVYDFVEENGWLERDGAELEYLYIDHILLTTINRLEAQDNPEKRAVIDFLRKEVNQKYPHFYKDEVFQQFILKRRIVAFLNAKGLSRVSKFIFDLKKRKG